MQLSTQPFIADTCVTVHIPVIFKQIFNIEKYTMIIKY